MANQIDKGKLKRIIHDGDAEELVNTANDFGKQLADDKVSKSQIRNVFGEVRNIDVSWSEPNDPPDTKTTDDAAKNIRQLLLLKPRMAYQGKRDAKTLPLMNTLTDAIDLVVADKQIGMRYRRFKFFAEFFEAILAYHAAAGGR